MTRAPQGCDKPSVSALPRPEQRALQSRQTQTDGSHVGDGARGGRTREGNTDDSKHGSPRARRRLVSAGQCAKYPWTLRSLRLSL